MDPWNPRAEQRAILDCPKSVTANLQCEPEMPSSQHPTNEGQTEKHPQAKGETRGEIRGETDAGRFISTRETKWPKKIPYFKIPLENPLESRAEPRAKQRSKEFDSWRESKHERN